MTLLRTSRLVVPAAIFMFAGLGVAATPETASGAVSELDTAALLADVRTLSSPQYGGRFTGSEGNRLAQEHIKRRFSEIGIASFGASFAQPFAFTQINRAGKEVKFSATNLIGHIRGTVNPDRYMVVSAHYDHLGVQNGATYLGADDNASGVAALLAVAAHFKRHPPKNTIVFAAFDAEELGHNGAYHFIKLAPFPIEKVALNLNFDMVSRNDKNEIYAAGARYTPSLKPLVELAAAGSSVKVRLGHDSRVPGAPPDYDWTFQSDHAAFYSLKIPFLYFGVEDHADYHKPGDSFDKIQPAFFAEVTRMLVSAADILDRNLDTVK